VQRFSWQVAPVTWRAVRCGTMYSDCSRASPSRNSSATRSLRQSEVDAAATVYKPHKYWMSLSHRAEMCCIRGQFLSRLSYRLWQCHNYNTDRHTTATTLLDWRLHNTTTDWKRFNVPPNTL